jgi:hypothetical protein
MRVLICAMVAGAMALLATSVKAAAVPSGFPSPAWWSLHETENLKTAEPASGVYQPKTDDDFAKKVKQARTLPLEGKAWRNVGPFGGLGAENGIGPWAGRFGKAGGIGTAIAVDPNDATGDTVYLGGHGGLYKSTDGGATLKNITDGKLLRYSIGAVAVDPKDSKTLYVGTGVAINTVSDDAAGTGMYVSHDGGLTFTSPAQNTDGYGVNAIVVLADRTVLAGTNYGLWRSTDLGDSFQKVALPTNAGHSGPAASPLGNTVSSIAVRPGHPNEVVLAVGWARGKEVLQPGGTVIGTGNGLYRSTKGGAPGSFAFVESTAQLTWAGASTDPVGRVSVAFANGDVMWALVQDAGRAYGKTPVTDLPTVPSGLPAQAASAANTARGGAVTGLNVAFGATALNGLYRSADNGATWTLAATAQTLATALGATTASSLYALYAAGIQSTYNNWVAADPTDPDRVYVGLEEVYAGDFLGAPAPDDMTWTAIQKYSDMCGFLSYPTLIPGFTNGTPCPEGLPVYGGGTTHPDQHAIAFAKTESGYRMYTGNDGGWWVQDSHSLTDGTNGYDNNAWRTMNYPATVLPWDVAMLQDGSIGLALQDNGTNRLRKDGTSYAVCGGDGVIVYPGTNANSYYCGLPGAFILATTDDFRTTVAIPPPLASASFLSPWVVDRTDGNHILAAGGDVAETLKGPDSSVTEPFTGTIITSEWKTVFTPGARDDKLPWDSSAAYTRGNISYVGMCAVCRPAFSLKTVADPSKIHPVVATNVKAGCTAVAGDDPNKCWHLAASKGLPHQQISGIAVDPKDARTIYVTLRQYIVMTADPNVTGDEKVMVSHDAGETFTDVSGNLPRADAHAITLRDGRLIVASDVGIFTAPAGSQSWSRLGTGLPEVPYRSMKLDLTGRYLVGGAYGRGAWVYDFGTSGAPVKKPATKVKGVHKTRLPATGAESNVVLALVLLAGASLLSRRSRRT